MVHVVHHDTAYMTIGHGVLHHVLSLLCTTCSNVIYHLLCLAACLCARYCATYIPGEAGRKACKALL